MGVLAHEVSHVTAQHGVRSMINTLGWFAALQLAFGDASGIAGAAVAAAPFLIQLQYSQGFETEADRLGVGLMRDAGIDPNGLLAFFDKLMASEQAAGVDLPSFLSSHPATGERINNISAMIEVGTENHVDLSEPYHALKELVEGDN
jgi:predicted Zn-dependent protease